MNIGFLVRRFRDRDFWPLARAALEIGHRISYRRLRPGAAAALLADDRRDPFDLVLSSDRAMFGPDREGLHSRMKKRPLLLEWIFNGLGEACADYADDRGDFGGLAEARMALGLMDETLASKLKDLRVDRALCLPCGVASLPRTDPGFYVYRGILRREGPIRPEDIAGRPTALGRFGLRLRGREKGKKSIPVVFLGECKVDPNRELVERIRRRFVPRASLEALLDVNRWRNEVGQPEHNAERLGLNLLEEHFCALARAKRRLGLVRALQRALGKRFFLYGDDFIALGLTARPTDHRRTERKYLSAQVAIDFGSNSFDRSLYTRSSRIIHCGAMLLQLRQPDAEAVFGSMASEVTFTNEAQMVERIEHHLGAGDPLEDRIASLHRQTLGTGAMTQALSRALAQLDRFGSGGGWTAHRP